MRSEAEPPFKVRRRQDAVGAPSRIVWGISGRFLGQRGDMLVVLVIISVQMGLAALLFGTVLLDRPEGLPVRALRQRTRTRSL